MKIVIADMQYPKGHKSFNSKIIELLSIENEVTVVDYKDYFNNLEVDKIDLKHFILPRKNIFLKTLGNIYNSFMLRRKLRKIDYDYLFFLSFENIGLSFTYKLFNNLVLVHHNNVDLLSNRIELNRFKKYMNKVKHIVLEDFIKQGLIKKSSVNENNVFVIPHPLMEEVQNDNKSSNILLVGLGLGNDDEFIKNMIKYFKEEAPLSSIKTKIILRSSNFEYEDKNLKVFNGYLDYEDYLKMYADSSATLMCYPDSFENRFSGSFMNSFQARKKVLSTNTGIGRYLVEKYPENCKIFSNAEELVELIKNIDYQFNEKEYEQFMNNHRDENLQLELKKIFQEVI